MVWINQMLNYNNFFQYGYILDENCKINFSKFKSMNFKNCNEVNEDFWLDKNYLQELKKIQSILSVEYISKIFNKFEMKECGMWEGVDEGSSKWHNDYLDGDKFNSNILVYLDDNTEKNGNSIEVRGPNFSHILYPKENQLIWLNQKKIFQHKATHKTGRRRVLSFEYFIPELI